MQDFKKVIAWKKSHSLALRVYAVSAAFPKAELFGLTPQVRRAAVSIPANIAEGACRGGKSFAHFLRISAGSAGELEYLVILASDLELISRSVGETLQRDVVEAKKLIAGLLKAVNRSNKRQEPKTEN